MRKTYFGLDVVDSRMVRYSDIEKLPFFDFWLASMYGSAMPISPSGEQLVWLYDWESFCTLFIKTGRHRFQSDSDAPATGKSA